MVEESPFISNVSLIEIGIPNKGGNNLSSSYFLSLNVQFLFFVFYLILSHY
jgi:hypothetical protein